MPAEFLTSVTFANCCHTLCVCVRVRAVHAAQSFIHKKLFLVIIALKP